jgi:pimeloyl-ACP methyl ester carboxylesterase
MSDKDAHGRFPRIAELANQFGWSTLAFDFSGCGASDNAPITVEREIEDLRAAIAFVQARNYRRLALLGNSLGARICLSCADCDPATMVLIGGALEAMQYNWEEYFTPGQLEQLHTTGRMCVPVDRTGRTECLLEQQTLDDFALFNQDAIFGRLRCPVLLIYGDSGWEEQTLLAKARMAFPRLPAGSRLEVIPGAEHGCKAQFDQVLIHLKIWLQRIQKNA